MGAVFGTPDYMSPEQALGQPIDARSDLYSIGVMLYELLTGERPFKGGAVTIMRKHVLEDVPSLPASLLETLDPRFNGILQKLLQKSAQDRYASATELGQTLSELVAPKAGDPAPATLRGTSSSTFVASDDDRRDSVSFAEPREPARVPKKRRSFGIVFLTVVALGAFVVYGWGPLSPRQLWTSLWGRVAPTALAPSIASPAAPSAEGTPKAVASSEPSAAESAPGEPVALPLPSDSASAAAADSAGPSDVDELTATTPPDDSATSPLASGSPASSGAPGTTPHHGGSHVMQNRPGAKPIHKAYKPSSPAQKHVTPFIPPSSPWFKN
jgi:serine/threonine-protein kinase